MQSVSSCLWFDGQAEEAAQLYTSTFKGSKILRSARMEGRVLTIDLEIEQQRVLALNGGPHFKFSPASYFFVTRKSADEVRRLWTALGAGGEVRMPLQEYPWSKLYGWTTDRFGMNWQISLSPEGPEKIAMGLLFVAAKFGQGSAALDFYTSLIPGSSVQTRVMDEKKKSVMHAAFKLAGADAVIMDGEGPHGFDFTPAFSIVVANDTQAELDRTYAKLLEGGTESQCGWVTDRFGVSWQVVPSALGEWMSDDKRAPKVMAEIMKMKKLDIATLEKAART